MPFSHKRHGDLKIECVYCHPAARTGERAGFPEAARCMTCHRAVKTGSPEIRKLAALPQATRLTPATPVYRLPDFVFFSHARHDAARIECQACHGAVFGQDAVKPVLAMKMRACVDCHRSRRASVACNVCHELNQ